MTYGQTLSYIYIYTYTYNRSFLIGTFIWAQANIFSRRSSESTLDERYLFLFTFGKSMIEYNIIDCIH